MGTTLHSGLYQPDDLEAPGWGALERPNWAILDEMVPEAWLIYNLQNEFIQRQLNIDSVVQENLSVATRLTINFSKTFEASTYSAFFQAFRTVSAGGAVNQGIGKTLVQLSSGAGNKTTSLIRVVVQFEDTDGLWKASPDMCLMGSFWGTWV